MGHLLTVWVGMAVLGLVQNFAVTGIPAPHLVLYEESVYQEPILDQGSNNERQESSELPIPVLYQEPNPTEEDPSPVAQESSELPIPVLYPELNPAGPGSSEPPIPELYENSNPVDQAVTSERSSAVREGSTTKPANISASTKPAITTGVHSDVKIDEEAESEIVQEELLLVDEARSNQEELTEVATPVGEDAESLDVDGESLQEYLVARNSEDPNKGEEEITTETMEDGESLQEYLTADGDGSLEEKTDVETITAEQNQEELPTTEAARYSGSLLEYLLSKQLEYERNQMGEHTPTDVARDSESLLEYLMAKVTGDIQSLQEYLMRNRTSGAVLPVDDGDGDDAEDGSGGKYH